MKPKLIAIVGQTATGKSGLAIEIAKKFEGEVVSADSRQVYKGLNLGTGKVTRKEMSGIPHHLLDVADPKRIFNVSDFKKLADEKIQEILKKGKLPILCGGTGFYIHAVVDNISYPEVKPNEKLRKQLEKKSAGELFKILKKIDPRRAHEIDRHNKVRLIRAIEIAKKLGSVPAIKKAVKNYEVLQIGLKLPEKFFKQKINARLIERIRDGMLREAKRLHIKGLSWKRMEALGLEYKYEALYLQKKITKKEMVEKLSTEIWRYAKRQDTWFKKDSRIQWFNPKHKKDLRKINHSVKNFLK